MIYLIFGHLQGIFSGHLKSLKYGEWVLFVGWLLLHIPLEHFCPNNNLQEVLDFDIAPCSGYLVKVIGFAQFFNRSINFMTKNTEILNPG